MKRPGIICVISLFLLALACTAGGTDNGHPHTVTPVSLSSVRVPTCVQMPSPRLVVLVRGLVGLASANPTAGAVVEQDDVILALVEARQGLNHPCPVAAHQAKLECFANCRLEGPLGSLSSLDLADSEIEFPFHSSQKVKMHHEPLQGHVPDPARDLCSLGWLPSAPRMTGHDVKATVFGRPDPALVTSRVVIGAGEVFTYDHWLKDDGSGDVCSVVIPGVGSPRAMTKTLAIVVPMSTRQVAFRRVPANGYAEDWWVEAVTPGQDIVVTLTNHPVSSASQFDFTGHYRLLDGSHANCNAAPKIRSVDCVAGVPGLDPQCTPSESKWP